jgi:hypothetical protein
MNPRAVAAGGAPLPKIARRAAPGGRVAAAGGGRGPKAAARAAASGSLELQIAGENGGVDGTRTRDLLRDRQAF